MSALLLALLAVSCPRGQVAHEGRCYLPVNVAPPCGEALLERDGKCYAPVPRKQGAVS